METNLLDKMLSTYRSQKTPVTIVLQNNARIFGRIGVFDSYIIVMENQRNEIVYRHAISALLPYSAAEQPHPREQKAAPSRPAPKPVPKPARPAPPATAKTRPPRPEHKPETFIPEVIPPQAIVKATEESSWSVPRVTRTTNSRGAESAESDTAVS